MAVPTAVCARAGTTPRRRRAATAPTSLRSLMGTTPAAERHLGRCARTATQWTRIWWWNRLTDASANPARRRSGPENGLDDLQAFHRRQRFARPLERVLPADQPPPGEPPIVPRHQGQRSMEVRELVAPAAEDRGVAAVDVAMGVEDGVAGVGVLADHHVAAGVAQH